MRSKLFVAVLLGTAACGEPAPDPAASEGDLGTTTTSRDACRLVVDLAHGESAYSNPNNDSTPHAWAPAMALLTANGFSWSANEAPIASSSAAMWIVAEPTAPFTAAEIDAIEAYVEGGGGLLLSTDFHVGFMNPLAARLGATFRGDDVGWQHITDFTGHVLGDDVASVYWPQGSTLEATDPGVRVVATFEGRPVIAMRQLHRGRVVFVAENEAFARIGLDGGDNARLLLNIADWLARCR